MIDMYEVIDKDDAKGMAEFLKEMEWNSEDEFFKSTGLAFKDFSWNTYNEYLAGENTLMEFKELEVAITIHNRVYTTNKMTYKNADGLVLVNADIDFDF